MSVTSSRTVQIQFNGDVTVGVITSALDNVVSPGIETTQSLVLGANTITAPVIASLVVTGLLIIPPSGNTNLITLKGVTGDVGIPLHLTDPTSLALDTSFVSLVLNAAAAIANVRLIWT
jgi:hypothetical protein